MAILKLILMTKEAFRVEIGLEEVGNFFRSGVRITLSKKGEKDILVINKNVETTLFIAISEFCKYYLKMKGELK